VPGHPTLRAVPVYVSLLRAVNVGGRNRLPMAGLRDCYADLGHGGVVTYLQSGNVVSQGPDRSAAALASKVTAALRDTFGIDVAVLVRTAAELDRLVAAMPFAPADPDDKSLHVTFLPGRAPASAVAELEADRFLPDRARVRGREVYLQVPGRYGRTRLTNAYVERLVGAHATTRNWRTVTELCRLAGT